MSAVELERLEQCHEALIGALDANEPDAIAQASAELQSALGGVRDVETWRTDPQLKQAAERIRGLADAAQVRVNFLTDRVLRRIDAIAAAGRTAPVRVYDRQGR
jgi:hypothetical protein